MIKEIQDNLFRVRIPMPDTPLGEVNAYVIRSQERNLIIDTGLFDSECRETMFRALETLRIDLSQTDIFCTHHHGDHVGLVADLITEGTLVFCHRLGWEYLKKWRGLGAWIAFCEDQGFPHEAIRKALAGHTWERYRCRWNAKMRFMTEGDTIRIGGYLLVCRETPGHCADHLCLYEPNRKILFSGDHILGDISPNILSWEDDGNPLKDYMDSLEKVAEMEISLVLPGHRGMVADHRKRIRELLRHHQVRLEEIMGILSGSAKTAYQVASETTWHINAGTWERFPVEQQMFAVAEVAAHLRYLEAEGKLRRKNTGGSLVCYESVSE